MCFLRVENNDFGRVLSYLLTASNWSGVNESAVDLLVVDEEDELFVFSFIGRLLRCGDADRAFDASFFEY